MIKKMNMDKIVNWSLIVMAIALVTMHIIVNGMAMAEVITAALIILTKFYVLFFTVDLVAAIIKDNRTAINRALVGVAIGLASSFVLGIY